MELKEDRITDMLYLLSKKYSQDLEQKVRKMLGSDWLPRTPRKIKREDSTNASRNTQTRSYGGKQELSNSGKGEEVEIGKKYASTTRGRSNRKQKPSS